MLTSRTLHTPHNILNPITVWQGSSELKVWNVGKGDFEIPILKTTFRKRTTLIWETGMLFLRDGVTIFGECFSFLIGNWVTAPLNEKSNLHHLQSDIQSASEFRQLEYSELARLYKIYQINKFVMWLYNIVTSWRSYNHYWRFPFNFDRYEGNVERKSLISTQWP